MIRLIKEYPWPARRNEKVLYRVKNGTVGVDKTDPLRII